MGMSREQKQLYNTMNQLLQKQMQPESNPAQNFLTNQALESAEFIKSGDYRQLPKNSYFNFEMPEEQRRKYMESINIGGEGRFALGDNAGEGKAMGLAKNYLADKFARDTSLNFQNNISNASNNITAGLQQASGYKTGNDAAIINALQSAYSMAPKGFSWSGLIGGALNAGTQLLSKVPGI